MIVKLHGTIKPYAWGGHNYIAKLLGQPIDERLIAELWFGDHPQGPALIETDQGKIPFNEWLEQHPQVLSSQSKNRYGQHLPYLLKILDVRLPLSIQLHPNKEQAEQGYALEERNNIPLAQRNYPDNNHKPESMIALSEFWLLHGFAPIEIIMARIAERPSLTPIAELIRHHGLRAAYTKIMTANQQTISQWLAPILQAPAPKTTSTNPDYWLHYTKDAMQIDSKALDPGLLSFYLFNIVKLEKGEGIFQPARLPHAYLRGQNIEIMAASNNVLRAGLTSKYVDIPELLNVIDYQSIQPKVIDSPHSSPYQYPAPVDDYTLTTADIIKDSSLHIDCSEASIVLIVEGQLKIQSEDTELFIHSAQAAFLPYGTSAQLIAQTHCYVIIASNQ